MGSASEPAGPPSPDAAAMTQDAAPHYPRFHRPVLVFAAICALALAGLSALVYVNPVLSIDASIERWVQSINYGPITPLFDFYRQIGGPYGLVAEAVVFAIILLLNRHSWRLLIAGAAASGWYFLLSHLIVRVRPTTHEVLRVTEHPGASSYPSGHTILFVFYAAIVMLCLGMKFIPKRWRPVGWAVAVLFVVVGGISRMYSGAHWPTDVLAGLLIGIGWMGFVTSIRWISDPVLEPRPRRGEAKDSLPAA